MLLHMWYDQLHCSLYRLTLPGADESASEALLSTAPEGWVAKVRYATYLRGCSLRQKFVTLKQHFPTYRPENWQFATLALEVTRNLLQYLAVAYPSTLPDPEHRQTLQGFEDIVTVISRMTPLMIGIEIKVSFHVVWADVGEGSGAYFSPAWVSDRARHMGT